MRTRTILIGALLLGSAGLAQAQGQQQQTTAQAQTTATPAASFVPKYGRVDFGFRSENVDGDFARYNRFRDWRQGGYLDRFKFEKETETTFFNATANNVGYRDQRYSAEFHSIGKLKASFEWDQIPLFLSETSESLYTDRGNGVLSIDDGIQAALQAAVATGNNSIRDQAIASAMTQASQFDLRNRRDVGTFNLVYSVNRDIDLKFNLKNTNRNGNQVFSFGFGTSPGLNPSVEMGVPVDDRSTDVKGYLEFANAKGLFNIGYLGSWYDNSVPIVRFDNPLRATDISAGPSVGQAGWWPSSASYSINTNGSYKLGRGTRASAAISVGRWTQDEAILPYTSNTALVAPPLQRATVDSQADILSMLYSVNSRPMNAVWLNASYRYYDYDNKTPHFTATQAIIGDWNVGTQVHETEPASFKRQNLDLDASFTPFDYLAFGVGYGREQGDRTYRIFEETVDDTFRVTADSTGNQYYSIRAKYEFSSRTGSGFEEHLLDEVGEQPETRHFDIANRDRTRASILLTVTPAAYVSINGSVGTGKDEYDDTGFGLRDAKNNNWSAGIDVMPVDTVTFGLSYGYDKYTAYQYSRTANPLDLDPAGGIDVTFLDPRRDWWTDQNDTVKTFFASLDLMKTFPKTDIRIGYDLSDGKATYVYGVPANFPLTAPSQLAPVKNRLTIATADVQYYVRPNIALGVAYHFEDYNVDDFGLGDQTIDRLDPRNGTTGVFANTIYSGYLFMPYTAHSAWLRMTYLW